MAGAVRTMAENAPSAVTVVELPTERLPEHVERTVYRLIADFLADAGRMPSLGVSIAVRRAGGDVVVEIEYERTGVGNPASVHLADRVAAAGGQLRYAGRGDRRRLIASLPCG